MPTDPLSLLLTLIQPLTLALLLALAAVVFRRPLLRVLAAAALLALALVSTPWCSERLAASLESRYVTLPASDYGEAQAIVLLGGGVAVGKDRRWDLTASADRIVLAAELWHYRRAPTIIASGGLARQGDWSEAAAMRYMLRWLGVAEEAIVVEPRARNTREHPAHVRPLLQDPDAPVLLVTSALHMPRAVRRFRDAGIAVMAAPADRELLRYDDVRDFLPDSRALERSSRVVKEYLGLLHAWLLSPQRLSWLPIPGR